MTLVSGLTLNSSFAHEARSVPHGVIDARVICAKRHVRDEKRRFAASCDSPTVVEHFFEGEASRRVVAEAYLGERVPYESDIDIVRLASPAGGEVVRSEHRDWRACLAKLVEMLDGNFLAC